MWNKELLELLIAKYQEHDILYDMRSPAYLDRAKRLKSLSSICQELKVLNKNITVEAVKKKIHILRGQYIKESRLIANSKRNDDGTEEVYIPRLWYYPLLHFLKPHCKTRKPTSNISDGDESECDNSSLLERVPESNSESEPQPFGQKRKKSFDFEERIDNIKRMMIRKSETTNCFDWLGKQVIYAISKLKSEKVQQDAIWDIQKALRRAWVLDSEGQQNCSYLSSPESPLSTLSQDTQSYARQRPTSSKSSSNILKKSSVDYLDDDDF